MSTTTHPEFGHDTTAEEVIDTFADRVKGHVFLVTGPSPNGIAAQVLRSLATAHPAALLLVGRSPAKYAPLVEELRAVDGAIRVAVYAIDFNSLASVRAGAAQILRENDKIDVQINSAGVIGIPVLRRTVDGIEENFASNHVGHFLLTNLLMPLLRASDEPRVVNISSAGHAYSNGDYSDPNFRNRVYTWQLGYGQGKLANIHFSQELASRVAGLVSVSLHPGVTLGTSLGPDFPKDALDELVKTSIEQGVRTKTRSQGASTPLVAALDPNAKAFNGAYLEDCQVGRISGGGADKQGASAEMWAVSEQLVGQTFSY